MESVAPPVAPATPAVETPMEEPPFRAPIATAPLSVILLALGTPSETAESLSAWKAYLATLEREFELLLVQPAAAATDANQVLAEVQPIAFDPAGGYGQALQTAFRLTQFPLVLLTT